MATDQNREYLLFAKSLEMPNEERETFVRSACRDDPELRDAVLALLASHEAAGDTLERMAEVDLQKLQSRLKPLPGAMEAAGDRIGRYRLLEVLGEGAWGTVWRARQMEGLKREVALKILKRGLDTEEFLARFEAERNTLALMDHPNIARVLDAGATERGRPYLVMELVKGMPLIDFANKRRLSVEQRVALFVRICRGMDHAHAKGVIHRDLKPSNILVTVEGDENVPKIIDFGVAKSTQFQLTDKTLFTGLNSYIGTPTYSSPEQLEFSGMEVDSRSDVYSLGAVLYKLLCGRPPFDLGHGSTGGLQDLRTFIREKDPLRPSSRFTALAAEEQAEFARACDRLPSSLASRLRGDLDWIIGKCLEKDRAQRYDSAAALAEDLEAHLAGDPISARAPSLLGRARRFIKRKRPAIALWLEIPAAILVLLAVVLHFRSEPKMGRVDELRELSIAVLPLENRSVGGEDVTNGIHQILHSQLGRIHAFHVISQTTMEDLLDDQTPTQEVANRIGADLVVAGSAGVSGEQVGVNIELVDSRSGKTLWVATHSRVYTTENVFLIQMQIAAGIAQFLEARLSPEEREALASLPSENFEALGAYFEAVNLPWHIDHKERREVGQRVVSLLERAVELDPDFAMAWEPLGIALHHFKKLLELPFAEAEERTQESLRRALDLEPRMPDAWTSLAFSYRATGNVEAAEAAALRAVELDPSNARAWAFLGTQNFGVYEDPARALVCFEKARAHTPASTSWFLNTSRVRLGRIEEALADGWEPQANGHFFMGQLDKAIWKRRQNYRERRVYANDPNMLSLLYYALRLNERAAFFMQRRIEFFPDWQEEGRAQAQIYLLVLRGKMKEAEALFWQALPELGDSVAEHGWQLRLALRDMMVADHAEGRTAQPRDRYQALLPGHFEREFVLRDKPVYWRVAQDVAFALQANGEVVQANILIDEVIRNIGAYPVLYPVKPLLARALLRGDPAEIPDPPGLAASDA